MADYDAAGLIIDRILALKHAFETVPAYAMMNETVHGMQQRQEWAALDALFERADKLSLDMLLGLLDITYCTREHQTKRGVLLGFARTEAAAEGGDKADIDALLQGLGEDPVPHVEVEGKCLERRK